MNIFKTGALAVLLFGATYASGIASGNTDTVAVAVTFGDYIEIIDFNVVSEDGTKSDGVIDITPKDTTDGTQSLDVLVEFNSSAAVDFTVGISEVKKASTDDVTDKNIFSLSSNTATAVVAQADSGEVKIIDNMVLTQEQDATDYDEPWDLRDTDYGSDKEWTIKFSLTATSN
ncbi:hypothetical protein N9N03_00465 [Chlamydiia bacterium]|nr:hypothetical protein [Chlamydiia bacterium]